MIPTTRPDSGSVTSTRWMWWLDIFRATSTTGAEGELVYVPAAYSKSVSTLFQKNQDPDAVSAERLKGKIVISEGFAFPQKMLEFEQLGAVGVIAVNPGTDIHWGTCTSIWGTPIGAGGIPVSWKNCGQPILSIHSPIRSKGRAPAA